MDSLTLDGKPSYIYIYIYIYHHHHHVALVARISLTLSRHSSLSFIALGRSSGQHPVSSHSCWMYVRAGRPVFARLCVGVHKNTSLMSSSLLIYIGLAFWVNRVSIPATGRYCLATLMSSDGPKQICLWMTIYIYIYNVWLNWTDTSYLAIPPLNPFSRRMCLLTLEGNGMEFGRHCTFPKYFRPNLESSSRERMINWHTQWRLISLCINVKVVGKTSGREI